MNRKTVFRNLAIVAGIVLAIWAVIHFTSGSGEYKQVDTSVAIAQLQSDNVESAVIKDKEQQLELTLKNGNDATDGSKKTISSYPAGASETIFDSVKNSGADSYNTEVSQDSWLSSLLVVMLPMLLILAVFLFLMNRMQGGGRGGVMGFGKSKAKQLTKDMPKTTFDDVAGADEAVEELYEIKDFLANPARYQALGAKIPKGVLLYGPPGTGKTLLARAVAGEAGVPFYTISGSDFVEMFVGVGASRVRDLFEQAKQNSPCIIFVDEIDAVGRQRGAGLGGGHDEREQTLNQLLVEMDGFGITSNIILIAATNRPDILDPALLRPGRFDRQIPVTAPDLAGRRAVLKVHGEGMPISPDADLDGLAKRTVGMSGADLANVINEAALLTARENGDVITGEALEESVDRVVGGPRRKSRIISEHEKKITAYHEGGHALAAWAMPDIEPVYKVTILARGRTGGHALTVPEDDKGLMTRSEMIARLVMAMGGRAAEELVFHEPTTGASSDIDMATKVARSMVTEYGMSARLGAVKYGQEQADPFLGRSMGQQADYSLEVAHEIDEEVRRLIEAAHTEAWSILNQYREVLDALAGELLEKETLHRKDLERVFAAVDKRPRITAFNDFGSRTPSDKPPIKTPGELAIERGEPWPPPAPVPAFRRGREAAGAGPGAGAGAGNGTNGSAQPVGARNGAGRNGARRGDAGHGDAGAAPAPGRRGPQAAGAPSEGPQAAGAQAGGAQSYARSSQQRPAGRSPREDEAQASRRDDPQAQRQGETRTRRRDEAWGGRPAEGNDSGRPAGIRNDYGAPSGWQAPGWPPRGRRSGGFAEAAPAGPDDAAPSGRDSAAGAGPGGAGDADPGDAADSGSGDGTAADGTGYGSGEGRHRTQPEGDA